MAGEEPSEGWERLILDPVVRGIILGNVESLGLSTPEATAPSAQPGNPPKKRTTNSARVPAGKGTKYRCKECNFGANSSQGLDNHAKFHVNKAKFQCSRCSYSVERQMSLSRHEARDHGQPVDQCNPDAEPTTSNEATRKEANDEEPSHVNQPCQQKENPPGLIPCPHCSFTTDLPLELTNHLLEAKHDRQLKKDDNTSVKPILTNEGKDLVRSKVYRCPSCRFWHRSLELFHVHVVTKHRKGADSSSGPIFQCSACTYKAKHEKRIRRHIRNVQPEDEGHAFARPTLIQPMPSDRYASRFKSVRVPKRIRSGFLPSPSKEKPAEQLADSLPAAEKEKLKVSEQMESTLKEIRKSLLRVEEAGGSIQANRVKLLHMEEAVRTSAAEIARLTGLKKELDDKVKDLTSGRIQAELAFRTAECVALKAQLNYVDADEPERAIQKKVIEEKMEEARMNEAAFKEMDAELSSTKKKADELDGKLKEAEESSVSAGQLLDIMRAELQSDPLELKDGPTEEKAKLVKELCSGAEELIHTYLAEEDKMLRLQYLDTLTELKKKETDLLARLNQYGLME